MKRFVALVRSILHKERQRSQTGKNSRPARRLVDNSDGTVTDFETALMWQAQCDAVERTHDEASEYCRELTLAAHSDWRLPTVPEIDELKSALLDLGGEKSPVDFDRRNTWTATHGSEYGYAGHVFMISDHTTMCPSSHFKVLAVRSTSGRARRRR